MSMPRAEVAALLLPGAVFGALLAAAAALLATTLEATERAALWALLEPRVALVLMLWFFAALGGGLALRAAWLRWGAAPGRLAEQVQVLLAADRAPPWSAEGSTGSRALASAVAALAAQRDGLRGEIAERVAAGSRAVEQERRRLAALMAELTQSVVVCNLDGRVLLFNARARLQFRALADRGGEAGLGGSGAASGIGAIGGAEPLALGRSIYGVLDRRLVAHALQAVQQRLARGVPDASAQFVTATRGGQLLRVQMAAVRAIAAAPPGAAAEARQDGEPPLDGFVLMLENITREMAEETERDRLLHALTEGSRGAIGNLRAAAELLDDAGIDAALRERFLGVIRDESAALAARLNEASERSSAALRTRWPLEDMLGTDLLAAAAQRLHAELGCRITPDAADPGLWLKVESYSLIQALLHLAAHLQGDFGVQRLQLRLDAVDGRAQLDLLWAGQAMSRPGRPKGEYRSAQHEGATVSTETVVAWETEPLQGAGGSASTLTLREVVARHGGAFWFERDRARQQACFRFLLPLAPTAGGTGAAVSAGPGESAPQGACGLMAAGSRPEFYDFDLFAPGLAAGALADARLSELSFTVFDTETTGLQPSAGDEIIQIGAVRIVGGKLRRQDAFETLVDPQRSLAPESVAIHAITPAMLAGQPRIASVLPAFHAFAHDSVLVAHNAAFDMRFLQLKEAATGVRFEQPVLDTLLLSTVVHPQQASHRLEAIAERLGVPVRGRHTALGDALVTAEVFLALLPLLQQQGITTLAQALQASQRSALARVAY
jgi:DNA polymerase-3 subunit epsilon